MSEAGPPSISGRGWCTPGAISAASPGRAPTSWTQPSANESTELVRGWGRSRNLGRNEGRLRRKALSDPTECVSTSSLSSSAFPVHGMGDILRLPFISLTLGRKFVQEAAPAPLILSAMALPAKIPLAEAWMSPRVTPAPSPTAKSPSTGVSRSLETSSRLE